MYCSIRRHGQRGSFASDDKVLCHRSVNEIILGEFQSKMIVFWTLYGVLLFPLNRPLKRKFARLYLGRFWLYRPGTLHASFGWHCLLAEKKLRQSERVTLASSKALKQIKTPVLVQGNLLKVWPCSFSFTEKYFFQVVNMFYNYSKEHTKNQIQIRAYQMKCFVLLDPFRAECRCKKVLGCLEIKPETFYFDTRWHNGASARDVLDPRTVFRKWAVFQFDSSS